MRISGQHLIGAGVGLIICIVVLFVAANAWYMITNGSVFVGMLFVGAIIAIGLVVIGCLRGES